MGRWGVIVPGISGVLRTVLTGNRAQSPSGRTGIVRITEERPLRIPPPPRTLRKNSKRICNREIIKYEEAHEDKAMFPDQGYSLLGHISRPYTKKNIEK